MTSDTVQSIDGLDTSCNMKLSSLHKSEIDNSCRVMCNDPMPFSKAAIAGRLRLLPEVCDATKTKLANLAGLAAPSGWSNWINDLSPKWNLIPVRSAIEICETYDLSLDWLYRGDLTSIRDQAKRLKIKEAERATQNAAGRPSKPRRMRKRAEGLAESRRKPNRSGAATN